MNIAFATSETYVRPTVVAINSALKNSNGLLKIYVLGEGLSSDSKRLISNLSVKGKAEIDIRDTHDELKSAATKLGVQPLRGGYATYTRLLLADLLIDIDEVLLVDSDTLILGDISGFVPDRSGVINAARDFVVLDRRSAHESPDLTKSDYYNMGVVWINLNEWRRLNLSKLLEGKLDKSVNNFIADQSVINRCLGVYIKEMSIKFNWYTYFHGEFPYEYYVSHFKGQKFLSETEFREARKNPVIVHFVGTWFERPWFKNSFSDYKATYLKYWLDLFQEKDIQTGKTNGKTLALYHRVCYVLLKFKMHGIYYWFRYDFIQKVKRIKRVFL